MQKRTFIAMPVPVPEKLKSEIDFYKKNVQGLNVKWVELDNLHLTLAFLGDTGPEQIVDIKEGLRELIPQFKLFRIRLTQTGAFKSLHNPQILWIGLEADKTLEKIYSEIQNLIKSIGFETDERAFKPHVTIARIKGFSPANNLKNLVNNREKLNENIVVENIVYYKSILMPAGPVYKPLEEYRLGI